MGWKVKKATDNSIQCSLCQSRPVHIKPIPKQKIELLMEEYPSQEWLGYLTGKVEEKEILIEDLVIPPHTHANGASAEAEPFHQPKDTVGIIHSHHSMGAFHSATDQEYVDKNYPVSITVAKRLNSPSLEFDSVSYVVTPCGKGTTHKAQIIFTKPTPLFDEKQFLQKAKENIDKGKSHIPLLPQGVDKFYYRGDMHSHLLGFNPIKTTKNESLPRDATGKFIQKKKEPPYIPARYRIGKDGRVMTQQEYNDMLVDLGYED